MKENRDVSLPDVWWCGEDLSVETELDLLEPVALSPALGHTGATLTTVPGIGSSSTGHLGKGVKVGNIRLINNYHVFCDVIF